MLFVGSALTSPRSTLPLPGGGGSITYGGSANLGWGYSSLPLALSAQICSGVVAVSQGRIIVWLPRHRRWLLTGLDTSPPPGGIAMAHLHASPVVLTSSTWPSDCWPFCLRAAHRSASSWPRLLLRLTLWLGSVSLGLAGVLMFGSRWVGGPWSLAWMMDPWWKPCLILWNGDIGAWCAMSLLRASSLDISMPMPLPLLAWVPFCQGWSSSCVLPTCALLTLRHHGLLELRLLWRILGRCCDSDALPPLLWSFWQIPCHPCYSFGGCFPVVVVLLVGRLWWMLCRRDCAASGGYSATLMLFHGISQRPRLWCSSCGFTCCWSFG